MIGQNIICFAKDWSEDPTSCNHVLRELSRQNKVLWVNSISTRSPNLASGRDLGKIFRKLASFFRGPKQVGDKMWLYTPIVLPYHHKAWAVAINKAWLRLTFGVLSRSLGMRGYQLWTFVPTSAEYVGGLGEEMIVYYCTDNWSQFSTVDGARIENMVERLAKKADVVFATSNLLVEKLRHNNPETHLAAHGVDYPLFASATQERLPMPADMEGIKPPILGFYGLIEDWLDQDLLARLATKHPDWNIVLVGRVCVDVSRLKPFPNIHFLGRKPHAELPLYCKAFTVGMIPHKVNELTRHMNPIKLREYLSAGLPVVATALPEVRHYGEFCIVAENYDEYEQGIERAIQEDSAEMRMLRSQAMRWETWDSKVAQLAMHVQRVQEQKHPERRRLNAAMEGK